MFVSLEGLQHLTIELVVFNIFYHKSGSPDILRFIDKYGTHIIVGVKMGGNDVIHIKQLQKSNLQPTEVQKLLKQLADERFSEDVNGSQISNPNSASGTLKVQHSDEFRI